MDKLDGMVDEAIKNFLNTMRLGFIDESERNLKIALYDIILHQKKRQIKGLDKVFEKWIEKKLSIVVDSNKENKGARDK